MTNTSATSAGSTKSGTRTTTTAGICGSANGAGNTSARTVSRKPAAKKEFHINIRETLETQVTVEGEEV